MVKELAMYTVICDNCGKDVNKDAEFSCWSDKTYAKDVAMEANWINEDNKDYCDDCFSYDDEDNLVLKNIENKAG